MRVIEVRLPHHTTTSFVVVDADGDIVVPVAKFLRFLEGAGRARNTVKTYAHGLRHYFEFLETLGATYEAAAEHLLDFGADFVRWLQSPASVRGERLASVVRKAAESPRAKTSINITLTAVLGFYEYAFRNGMIATDAAARLRTPNNGRFGRYKGFLHHALDRKPTPRNLLAQNVVQTSPKTLPHDQIVVLLDACTNERDRVLIETLYQSGLRIGEALALWVEDIDIIGCKLHVKDRGMYENGAEIKSVASVRAVHVGKPLINRLCLYIADYHSNPAFSHDHETNHVFVKIRGERIGMAMTYTDVANLFRALDKATGVSATAHLFRHTHATDCVSQKKSPEWLQRRMGHASYNTTVSTYYHPSDEDVRAEFDDLQLGKCFGRSKPIEQKGKCDG